MCLDLAPEHLAALMERAARSASNYFSDPAEDAPVFPAPPIAEVRALFDEPLPEEPTAPDSLLRRIEQEVYDAAARVTGPHFYGLISTGGNPFGLLGDVYATALNQTVQQENLAPSATAVERQVLHWIATFIGYPGDAVGLLTSGGSTANLVALGAARKAMAPYDVETAGLQGGPPLTVYVSTESHYSIAKAVDVLGIGKQHLRMVPVAADFRMEVEALERMIRRDRRAGAHPICVVAQGGAVNTGAVDPLEALADLCAAYRLWLHIDAAYGGPAAGTELAGHLFKGLGRADSVAIDPHKWLYVPCEAGCVLVREGAHLRNTYGYQAPYVRSANHLPDALDFRNYGLEQSRSFKALKVWLTFKGHGAARLRRAIEQDIETMRHLGDLLDGAADFERLTPVPLSVLCFRYCPPGYEVVKLDDLNQALAAAVEQDRRVYLTTTQLNGQTVLRACNVNYRTERCHVEYLLAVLRELGERLLH